MANEGISIEVKGLDRLLKKLGSAAPRVWSFVAKVYAGRLAEAVHYARQRYLAGGTSSDRLANRTGHLRAAFGMKLVGRGPDLEGHIGYMVAQPLSQGADALIYARIHEGWPDNRASTTIRPKRGKYLAIPLDAAKTPAGVAKGRPRDFPDTFVRRSRPGSLIIFQMLGNRTIQPLFLLESEIIVPARPALRPTMARFRPLILDDLRNGLPEAILPKGEA